MVLGIVTEALRDGQRGLAEAPLSNIEPEPTDAAKTSVGPVIGTSAGRAAAADILALARKGRAFDSIGVLHRRHSGLAILEGGALVVAASVIAVANGQDRDVHVVAAELLDTSD